MRLVEISENLRSYEMTLLYRLIRYVLKFFRGIIEVGIEDFVVI